MASMDGWDLALLVVVGYVALVTLVRLMIRRRNQVMDEFRREVRKEKGRREAQRRKEQAGRQRAA
jgi:heme exporter protein D